MNILQHVPMNFQKYADTIKNWIDDDSLLIAQRIGSSNYCVMVMDEDVNHTPTFSFYRFFEGGGNLHCSVDSRVSSLNEILEHDDFMTTQDKNFIDLFKAVYYPATRERDGKGAWNPLKEIEFHKKQSNVVTPLIMLYAKYLFNKFLD